MNSAHIAHAILKLDIAFSGKNTILTQPAIRLFFPNLVACIVTSNETKLKMKQEMSLQLLFNSPEL